MRPLHRPRARARDATRAADRRARAQALAPTWTALAELYRPVDSVVVAKLDATRNELDEPGVTVAGFPTIYLFPADAAAPPERYDHAHDLDSFSRFLKARGTRAFDVDGLKGGGDLKDEL